MDLKLKPQNETLDQAEKRVLKRASRNWLLAGTSLVTTITGLSTSFVLLASSNILMQAQTNHENVMLGVVSGGLSVIFGLATGIPLGRRLFKDHDSLDRIQNSKQERKFFEPQRMSSNYRVDAETGLPETYGSAFSRVKTRLTAKFTGAASGAILAVGSLADTLSTNPILTKPLTLLLDDLTTSRVLATVLQSMPVPIAGAVVTTWCLATASLDRKKLREIEAEALVEGGMDKRPSFSQRPRYGSVDKQPV